MDVQAEKIKEVVMHNNNDNKFVIDDENFNIIPWLRQ